MYHDSNTSAECRSDLPSTSTLQRVPRSALEREIGFLTHIPEIHEGHTATLLQPLSGGGGLYLTRDGLLAEVRPTAVPELLDLRRFSGCVRSMWEAVTECLPEARVGTSLPRFWLVRENTVAAGTVLYGVLDVFAIDVLERGSDRDEALHRVRDANADPEGYLQQIEWDWAREAVLAALHHHPILGVG